MERLTAGDWRVKRRGWGGRDSTVTLSEVVVVVVREVSEHHRDCGYTPLPSPHPPPNTLRAGERGNIRGLQTMTML